MARIVCMGNTVLGMKLRGTARPKERITLIQAFAIEFATNGHVQAWEWLDDPYIEAKIRKCRTAAALDMEKSFKQVVARGKGGGTEDGVLRNKARQLARCYQVNWAEVKRRAWEDARRVANWEAADVSHLMLAKDGYENE